jgi:hypothetical protein
MRGAFEVCRLLAHLLQLLTSTSNGIAVGVGLALLATTLVILWWLLRRTSGQS